MRTITPDQYINLWVHMYDLDTLARLNFDYYNGDIETEFYQSQLRNMEHYTADRIRRWKDLPQVQPG